MRKRAVVGVLSVIGWWSAVHACHSKIEGRGEATHVLGPIHSDTSDSSAR
jgi:hypothetical protein